MKNGLKRALQVWGTYGRFRHIVGNVKHIVGNNRGVFDASAQCWQAIPLAPVVVYATPQDPHLGQQRGALNGVALPVAKECSK